MKKIGHFLYKAGWFILCGPIVLIAVRRWSKDGDWTFSQILKSSKFGFRKQSDKVQ